ncbi:hypothetical protein MKZ38_003003 [Zalerion maritima]|uniref:Uncharacterized protein n=1 Tax=Zalerion maritima TaxID=339359 RepID=A0AAD5RNV2_9PEZI|nr:hypothetical protein MKZ38_003003 [Zalerion maritima]
MIASRLRVGFRPRIPIRGVSTLSTNPHIKAFPIASKPETYILTYLDKEPPTEGLAIGTTTGLPPTPRSFTENHRFVSILNDVLSEYAPNDEYLISQATAFAGPGGTNLGSGGAFFANRNKRQSAGLGGGGGAGGGGAGGASAQGGAGGGGVGGYVHLSDLRNPPDYGRIAWPEDILGSVEVDSHGNIIGEFQASGTYRVVTNEGM